MYLLLCYFLFKTYCLSLQLKWLIDRDEYISNQSDEVFFSIWHTICESQQNQENLQNINWFIVLYRVTSYCKAIALKCRQSASWGTSLPFFVLADKMRYVCFWSIGIFLSNRSINHHQYFSFIYTTNYKPCGRHGGLMVRAHISRSGGPGSCPGRGHCVVFLSKTLHSHSAKGKVVFENQASVDRLKSNKITLRVNINKLRDFSCGIRLTTICTTSYFTP